MSQVMFATRLPESQRKYIQYKAMDTGKQQQELIAEIIAFYQQHDEDFMAKFAALLQPSDSIGQETGDDA
ncbi:hypothetical protein PSYCG_09980 [Psychrobacter sp. G]|uniref:hypothetical protein n=1 Tax=Psychrobacter sp. G TaxID=571800 RepID=UPI000354CC28|nr:hypothetical protein [Psychrobacter sp. G]AGP49483.1 hypothetical protein PSYCG_09980 [Psychrobacter sp. G]